MKLHGLQIGINDFPGSDSDLSGCVNDARDISRLLSPNKSNVGDALDKVPFFHNAASNVTLLDSQAKLKKAIEAVGTVLSKLNDGDMAFLWFSQHGTFTDDTERHEALVFNDFGLWTDTKIARLLSVRNPKSFVVIGTDACHTGTKSRSVAKHSRFLPTFKFPVSERPQQLNIPRAVQRLLPAKSLDNVIHFAGCQAAEVCYDTSFNNRPNGAFTYYLLRALMTLTPGATFGDWFQAVCKVLPTKEYPQSPCVNAKPNMLAMRIPLKKG